MTCIHELFPEVSETLPSIRLGTVPTPLRRLPGLSDGPAEVWLKDESVFGDGGWGGNKVRKLEWLIPEAKRRGRSTFLTVGGLGTNWGLACTLYGEEHGLRTILALVDQPVDEHVEAQLERLKASGAEIHFTHTKARTIATVPWLMLRHRPYFLPAGGSSPVGALGAVEIALEIANQVEHGVMPEPSQVVTAVGSGGTAAGLLLGFRLAGHAGAGLGIAGEAREEERGTPAQAGCPLPRPRPRRGRTDRHHRPDRPRLRTRDRGCRHGRQTGRGSGRPERRAPPPPFGLRAASGLAA